MPAPPPAVRWPAWHAGADWLAAGLVLIAAVLAGSFAARNADVWRHLASGRLIATGGYPIGSDPFSFTSEGRPWVNATWLYDLGLYVAYSVAPEPGAVPVALKALAFAAAFGVGFLLRRPGQALWPWVVCAALGVLAAAPSALLRPNAVSLLFVAVTLVLIYRGRWAAGSWRMPGILAGLFAVWANADAWFILGPLAVLLVLIGELVQRGLLGKADASADADIFPAAPPVSALARALAVGIAACLLNPTLLAGLVKDPADALAQLVPADLGWSLPAEAANDRAFMAQTLSPLDQRYLDSPQLGSNMNGLAAAVLLIGGAIALAADIAHVRATHILLWVGFAAVALQQYRLIPFFAVVAAPLAAAHLNGLSARVRLGTETDPRTRVWLTLSGVGRILTVAAAALMALAGWPGWLHPSLTDSAFARRAEWAVEADPGPTRVARQLNEWRTDGHLPADTRGLASGTEVADYCLWFAPGNPVFVDSRLGFHRANLPDLLRLRRMTGITLPLSDERFDPAVAREIAQHYGAGYLILTGVGREADTNRDAQRARFLLGLVNLLGNRGSWELWHLDGRGAVVGRPEAAGGEKLLFDPVRLAFGPNVRPVPKGEVALPPPPKAEVEWYEAAVPLWEQFTARPKPLPPETDDSAVFDQFGKFLAEQTAAVWRESLPGRMTANAAVAGIAPPYLLVPLDTPRAADDLFAYPLLALRAARTAAAFNPERTETLRAVSTAYDSNRLPLFQPSAVPLLGPRFTSPDQPPVGVPYQVPGDRPDQITAALVRALARIPQPAECPPELALYGMLWNMQLSSLYKPNPPRNMPPQESNAYLSGQQIDLALQAVQAAARYAEAMRPRPELYADALAAGVEAENPAEMIEKDLKKREDELTELILPRNDALVRQPNTTPIEQFFLAVRLGLPGKAMEIFKESSGTEFGVGEQRLAAAVQLVELELRAGRLEEAAADVEGLAAADNTAAMPGQENTPLQSSLQYLRFRVALLAGDYPATRQDWVNIFAGRIPPLSAGDRARAAAFRPGREELAFAAGGGVPAVLVSGPYIQQAARAQLQLAAEAKFYFNCAVLALQEGNIKEAEERFQQALKPQGVTLIELGDVAGAAEIENWLRLIRDARK